MNLHLQELALQECRNIFHTFFTDRFSGVCPVLFTDGVIFNVNLNRANQYLRYLIEAKYVSADVGT